MSNWLYQKWFSYIHSNYLVYNTSWEDAAIDRELLHLNNNSSVLMITSAGCNALAYLLDGPRRIDGIDVNYRQNALVDLKIKLIRYRDYTALSNLFLTGRHPEYLAIYSRVRPYLEAKSRFFWDRYIRYFSPGGRGLYYNGTAGTFALILNAILKLKGLKPNVSRLLHTASRSEREQIFRSTQGKLWSGLSQYLWKWDGLLSLAGIPASQAEAVEDLNAFMQGTIYQLFVEQNPAQNHYWRVYLEGKYSTDCCPQYLQKENFAVLRKNIGRLSLKSSNLLQHLSHTETKYSHFILLDHMDWMAETEPALLAKQWKLILTHALPGATILFRSAYPDLSFLPPFVFGEVNFTNAKNINIQQQDRVGTYTATWLGVVQ